MKKMNALLVIGLIGILTIGVNFGVQSKRAFSGDPGIWWTAKTMPLSFEETQKAFELFIDGRLLQRHLADGTLMIARSDGEHHRLEPGDIAVRINNWHKVRASILAQALPSCFLFGVSLTMLVLGLAQIVARKRGGSTGGGQLDQEGVKSPIIKNSPL